jgi:hypothetical protein
MLSRIKVLAPLLALIMSSGCADDNGTSPQVDSTPGEGVMVHDSDGGSPDSAIFKDAASDDGSAPDTVLPQKDAMTLPGKDGPVLPPNDGFTPPKKDGLVFPKKDGFIFPKKDGFVLPGKDAGGTQADGSVVGCKTDQNCKVFTDCCSCKAVLTTENPGSCKMACTFPKCTDWGISTPKAYCAAQKCLVGDGTPNQCTTDKDCRVVNDCCYCLGLPTAITPPKCSIKTCFVNTCTSMGFFKIVPTAKCIKGMCRITTAPTPFP